MRKRIVLAAALSLGLASCSAPSDENDPSTAEAIAADSEELSKRLAFMAGHVEAGIALYRAGDGEASGPHLLHPVSEAYADEREGLDALGFDPAPFQAVSQALENGRPAEEIEPQLEAVEANLASMRETVGGDAVIVISYLMDLVAEEYAVGVGDGTVTDDGEYQDAWGFAHVARQVADDPTIENAEAVRAELDALIALWPEAAPIPPADPTPPEAVGEQAEKVNEALVNG